MKIRLIAPARRSEWRESYWDLKTLTKLSGCKSGGIPLALPTLAALTPPDVDVAITDEYVEPIDFDEKVDLVGITGMTNVIPRAYEIGDEYRRRGVKVVMGGIHVSTLPEEAIQHCDSVVIGEAEELWQQVIKDTKVDKLQKDYRAQNLPDISNSPVPRWELLKNSSYHYFTIQTGRGCPNGCDFCSVTEFNGTKFRHKKIERVLEEIALLQKIDPRKLIFFADDNLLSVPKYTEELCKSLSPYKNLFWMCQSSINRLQNDSLLELMYEAGCRIVFVGFESVSQDSLISLNKGHVNLVEEYDKTIEKIHSHKIAVFGSFILGTETDDQNVFDDIIQFIDKTNIGFPMVSVLTALPGSKLFQRMAKEDRVFSRAWQDYICDSPTYEPKNMSYNQLNDGHKYVLQQIYDYNNLFKRLQQLWGKGIFVSNRRDKRFSKTRVMATLYCGLMALLKGDIKQFQFLIRALWHRQCTSVLWTLGAVSFHQYAYGFKRVKSIKKGSYESITRR